MKAISDCIGWLKKHSNIGAINDQHAFTNLYKRTIGLTVSLLPQKEYPNGYIYFDQKITLDAKMVHCNYLTTTLEKEQRLKDNNLWNPDEEAFNLANKYYI